MNKEIVILAKSKKYNNYCIAGMDMKSKKWIRVISEDLSISYAVPKYDIICKDDTEVNILDVVKIDFKYKFPFFYQPENWVYNPTKKWEKISKLTIIEVYNMLKQDNEEYIFYSSSNKINSSLLEFYINLSPKNVYSLKLIFTEELIITNKIYKGKNKYYGSFYYKNYYYDKLPITDLNYLEKNKSNNNLLIKNAYLVLSLGECFKKDNCHYKLIASIIEK